jgi:hypothetical protein
LEPTDLAGQLTAGVRGSNGSDHACVLMVEQLVIANVKMAGIIDPA